MQQLVLLLTVALLATGRAGTINRHLGLLPDIDNKLDTSELTSKHARKFVALTRRPSSVMEHKSGTVLELTCEGMGAPGPNIRWFKNNAPVYEHELESNEVLDANTASLVRIVSTLLIPTTKDQDEYTCVVSTGLKTTKATTTVYSVVDGATNGATDITDRAHLATLSPNILVYYRVYVDTIGKKVVLPCKARGHPRPTITWKDSRGNVIKNGSRMKVLRSGELVISELRWTDMGEFTCLAENSFGTRLITTFVYPAKAG